MGIDPSIADAYFDRLDGSAVGPLDQSADFLQALAQMGVLNEVGGFELGDTTDLARDSLARALEAIPDSVLTVFGRSVFGGTRTEFDPVVTGSGLCAGRGRPASAHPDGRRRTGGTASCHARGL